MAQSLYGSTAIQKLADKYIEKGGEVVTIEEGILGWGLTICHGENLKTCVIKEVYLNCWSSGHKVRFYNKIPQKYAKMLKSRLE